MTRRGMTLVEMLVALTATLVIMAAIAQVFSAFGSAINASRAVLDVDAQLRTAAWRLRTDLAGVTARMVPPLSPEAGEGYFELIEGPNTDHLMHVYATATSGVLTVVPVPTSPPPFNTVTATSAGPSSVSDDRLVGDCDDVLLFTTRSPNQPFVGRAPGAANFESNVAEVAWFARAAPGSTNPQTYVLYRRQLLVMGYVGVNPFSVNNTAMFTSWPAYFNQPCDVSARLEGSVLYPNTLADLTRRESRFMHNLPGTHNGFPYAFVDHQALASETNGLIFGTSSARQGEDVVLTNVLAFDVRVFDPAAPVSVTAGGTPLVPGDPGFPGTNGVDDDGDLSIDELPVDLSSPKDGDFNDPNEEGDFVPVGSGAYVDIGNNFPINALLTGVFPHFAGFGQTTSGLSGSVSSRRTYDTWSTHYEANGRDDDGDSVIDEGSDGQDSDRLAGLPAPDGLIDEPPYDFNGDGDYDDTEDKPPFNRILDPGEDTNGNGILDEDDPGEMETSPPYPYPLRGIEVRIRVYEPSSRQVRQITVRQTFVPL